MCRDSRHSPVSVVTCVSASTCRHMRRLVLRDFFCTDVREVHIENPENNCGMRILSSVIDFTSSWSFRDLSHWPEDFCSDLTVWTLGSSLSSAVASKRAQLPCRKCSWNGQHTYTYTYTRTRWRMKSYNSIHLVGLFIAILVSSIVLPSIFISALAPLDRNSLEGVGKLTSQTTSLVNELTRIFPWPSSLSSSHFQDLS